MAASAPLDEGLIKALAHPLRWRIVEALVERAEASPVELARMLDQPLATVSHHVRVLRDAGSIELTRTEQRRGAIEHYYRALMPAFVDDEQWELIPKVLRRGISGQLFRRILVEATAAGEQGAFDATGSHLDRMIVELDDQGWMDASEALLDLLRRIQTIQSESDARRSEGAPARVSEIVLMHFEVAASVAPAEAGSTGADLPARSPPIPAVRADS
jgi:DNA-binding transcriptional ArsR family regulator